MRIFLIEWSGKISLGTAYALKKRGADIAYWTGHTNQINKDDFPTTVFHHSSKAKKNIPAPGLDPLGFEPLSAEIIKKFYECEVQALSMMNRISFMHSPSFSFDQRRRFYYAMLRYWLGVLNKFGPEAIVFLGAPHMIYDFVLYCLAKHLRVKTIMDLTVRIPDRLLLVEDIEGGSKQVAQELAAIRTDARLDDLAPDIREYYLNMIDENQWYYPFFPSRRSRRAKKRFFNYLLSPKALLRDALRGQVLGKIVKAAQYDKLTDGWEKLKNDIKGEYMALQSKPDLTQKFIFVPLNQQPERSTCPMGGVFDEQLLMIDILARAAPPDWFLYVKDHPNQFRYSGGGMARVHHGRFKGYYQDMARYPNVRLLPLETQGRDLISKCQAVANVNTSSGWEALFMEKPVLVFGWPQYALCGGAFKISNLDDCQKAIKIITQGYRPDKQKTLNFLAVLDKIAIKARYSGDRQKYITVSDEECIRNLAEALFTRLK